MKKSILFLLIFYSLYSCQGQENEDFKIDASKIKEITITNKVNCSSHNLEKKQVVLNDKAQIENIVDALSYCKSLHNEVNMKVNNGFFEISFNEGNKNHYYTINYTIYDGVIIRNDNNGNKFKNDRLEIANYKLFVTN